MSLTLHPDAGSADLEVELSPISTAAPGSQSQYTKRYLISLCHCGYIFLLDSSAQDTNSFSFLLTKHGQGNGSVLKNKPKNDALNSNRGGKASNA